MASYQPLLGSVPPLADASVPLLGSHNTSRGLQRFGKDPTGTATLLSCCSNLANTILGTGMLAMAHGFATGGMIPGIFAVLFCAMTGYLGLWFLAKCAAHPDVPKREASFAALSRLTYPTAGIFFDAAIAIKCFGVSISYLIILGTLMPQVVQSFEGTDFAFAVHGVLLDCRFWITLAMVILVPLSFLRKLDSLRYTSYIALVAVADLVFVVIYKFIEPSGLKEPGEIHLVRYSSSFVASLPIYVFAYTCAQNIFSVHNELISNTSTRMSLVLNISLGGAALIYLLVGILGYLTFGSKVSSNIIADYPTSTLIAVCRLSISLLVLFSYPLQLHPCRASLDKVLSFGVKQEVEDLEGEEDEYVDRAARDIPLVKFVAMTSGILLSSFLIAVNVSRLEVVLGFVGSTGSTTISFILPSLFYLSLFPPSSEHRVMRGIAKALLTWGCVVFVVCLTLNVREATRQRPEPGR